MDINRCKACEVQERYPQLLDPQSRALLLDDDAETIVGLIEDAAIGYCSYTNDGITTTIHYAYVHPDQRERGFGKHLVWQALLDHPEDTALAIVVEKEGASLLRSVGFRETEKGWIKQPPHELGGATK